MTRADTERSFLLIVLAAFAAYAAPAMTERGLALDGLLYANIGKLLAAGEGSFWSLPFYHVPASPFYDHPPLAIWLMQIGFHWFGDVFWVEKLHAGLVAAAFLAAFALCWRMLGSGSRFWWPLALLLIMPATNKVLRNNYLEGTLATFCLLAVAAAAAAAGSRTKTAATAWLCTVAALLWLAFLSKGFVGLFPLLCPLLLVGWEQRRWAAAIGQTALVVVVLAVLAAITLTVWPEAREALSQYLDQQVQASLSGERTIENGRGYLLRKLGETLLAPFALLLIASLASRLDDRHPQWLFARPTRRVATWLFLALGASLPLLASPRHYFHYLLPSLPFFAATMATTVSIKPPEIRFLKAAATIIFAVAIARGAWAFGADEGRAVAAARQIAAQVDGTSVGWCHEAREQYTLIAYLFRYHDLRERTQDSPDEAIAGPVVCATNPGSLTRSPDPVFAPSRQPQLYLWN